MNPNYPRIRIAEIQRAVAAHYGLSRAELLGRDHARRVAHPRQVAMYLARDLTAASYPLIGRLFRRDHTTVLHAERAVRGRIAHSTGDELAVLALARALLDGAAKESA